jgi:hypothetical protein
VSPTARPVAYAIDPAQATCRLRHRPDPPPATRHLSPTPPTLTPSHGPATRAAGGSGGFADDDAADGALVGLTHQTATLDTAGTILALTLIDSERATPGTPVEVVWGEHPGPGTDIDADLGFPRIRATVAPAPDDAHARTQYRRH